MNNKIAIAIPTYKYRYNENKDSLLCHVNELSEFYDVFIFLQSNDDTIYKYREQIKETDKIHLVVGDVTSIFEKRQFMYEYLANLNYDAYFQIDDDVKYKASKIDETTKRETSESYKFYNCPFEEMLNRMVEVAKEHDAGYVTAMREGYLGWQKPKKVNVNHQVNTAQFGYFNINKMKNANVQYVTDGSLWEDSDMILQFFMNKINCVSVCDYNFYLFNVTWKQFDTGTLNYDNNKIQRMSYNLAKKWHADLTIKKKSNTLHEKIKFKNYWGLSDLPEIDEYKKKLYELCENENFEEAKKLIMSK